MNRRQLLGASASVGLPLRASAQSGLEWPSRPIRVIVTFPPGGPNDIIARLYAPVLGALLKQPIIIDNKPGAGASIGVHAAVQSAPDGYTLVMPNSGALVINPHVRRNMPFRVPEDLTPISILATVPEALAAAPQLGVSNLPELVALARRRPGYINIATAGSSGISHFAAEMLRLRTNTDMTVVTYSGAAPALADLMSGTVHLLFADVPVVLPHFRSGTLRPIALASVRRSPTLPDLPITAESGFPEVLADNWYSLLGPAGLPASVLQRLSEATREASETPSVRDGLAALGAQATATTPAEFLARIARESEVWRGIAREANIRAE